MQKHHGHCYELYEDAETILIDGRIVEGITQMKESLKQMEAVQETK